MNLIQTNNFVKTKYLTNIVKININSIQNRQILNKFSNVYYSKSIYYNNKYQFSKSTKQALKNLSLVKKDNIEIIQKDDFKLSNKNSQIQEKTDKFNQNVYDVLQNKIIVFSVHKNKESVHSTNKFSIYQIKKGKKVINVIKKYISKPTPKEIKANETIYQKICASFMDVFFPKEYPYSVNQGYYSFSKYSFLMNISYFFLNFLFMQITIQSLGVSVAHSAAASAGLNWAIKEGLGQIASILAVAKLGVLAEKNDKQYRSQSMLVFHALFFLELSIMLKPLWFVPLASISTLLKITAANITIISRTGIFMQLAKKNNLIDLSLKFQNQSNVAVLIGTVLAYITSLTIPMTFYNAAILLVLCNSFCLLCVRLSYNDLVMQSFNYQRLYIFFKKYISENIKLNPNQVARFEKLLFYKPTIKFSTKSSEFVMKQDKSFTIKLLNEFKDCNYLAFPKSISKFNLKYLGNKYCIYSFLKLSAQQIDILKAFFFTIRFEEIVNFGGLNYSEDELIKYIRETINYTDEKITNKIFQEIDQLGWKHNFYSLEKNWSRYHTVIIDQEEDKIK